MVTLDDFDFELPQEQIAQRPLERRDASRLLVLDRASGRTGHFTFADLPRFLRRGDRLVVNDAKVIPARLLGRKAGTGGKAELLVVRPAASTRAHEALSQAPESLEWICIGQASKGLKAGLTLEFDHGLSAEIVESLGQGEVRVRFHGGAASLERALDAAGRLPLPPYIERPPTEADAQRYQTVYARAAGSAAAPTAGLHFTPELFDQLDLAGIARSTVTLDVGPGTFLPVRESDLTKHKMHEERYEVPAETARAIARTRAQQGRIVAVGTTVVRTLEAASDGGSLREGPGSTALFITPGFQFRQVDALITNFHLPRSTLLMLVSAFAGRESVLAAYREAVSLGYRFFSYGDAMLIADGVIP